MLKKTEKNNASGHVLSNVGTTWKSSVPNAEKVMECLCLLTSTTTDGHASNSQQYTWIHPNSQSSQG